MLSAGRAEFCVVACGVGAIFVEFSIAAVSEEWIAKSSELPAFGGACGEWRDL